MIVSIITVSFKSEDHKGQKYVKNDFFRSNLKKSRPKKRKNRMNGGINYSPVLASVYLRHFQDRSNRGHLLPLGQTLESPLDPALAQSNVFYEKVWVILYDSINFYQNNEFEFRKKWSKTGKTELHQNGRKD